jgi:hypothetical protein
MTSFYVILKPVKYGIFCTFTQKNARLAGLLYLIMILTGVYSLFFATSKIRVIISIDGE